MRLLMMVLAAALAAGAAHAASLETYAKLPVIQMPTISPGGSRVALIQRNNDEQWLDIVQLEPSSLIAKIPLGKLGYSSLTWVDDNHIIAISSGPGSSARVVDIEKRKIAALVDDRDLATVDEASVWTRAGRTVVVVWGRARIFGDPRPGIPAISRIDFATGKGERLASVADFNVRWGVNDGELIYQAVTGHTPHTWTLQLKHGDKWVDAMSVNTLDEPPRIAGRTPDGKNLVLQRVTEDHGLEFRSLSLVDGKLGDLVPEYAGVRSIVYDPASHLPIGGITQSMERNYVFFDPKDQALWDGILKLFPDEEVALASWSRDRSKVVVQITGLTHGVSYQVVDTVTHKATGIGQVYAGITPNDISDIAVATYPAKDGLSIPALFTLPLGREPKNLPMVVIVHDGPNGRTEAGYDGLVQALASKGYAVLEPQYRGSSGLGWKLESAAHGELGHKMQTDLSDGVRALASKGYIDPKRVCVIGVGYGGYAALAGVLLEKDVYRCAAAIEPWTEIPKGIAGTYWGRLSGATVKNDPIFDQLSLAKHVADASAPILIIHARIGGDEAVNLANALGRAKKPVELFPLRDIGSNPIEDTLTQVVQATATFLEKNNPPQ